MQRRRRDAHVWEKRKLKYEKYAEKGKPEKLEKAMEKQRAKLQKELRTLRGHELQGLSVEDLSKLEADVTTAARRIARFKEKQLRNALRVPDAYVCPITRELMHDPVFASDGHTYERKAIAAWLENHDTSPMTNDPLAHKHLTPNIAIRGAIAELLERGSTPAPG